MKEIFEKYQSTLGTLYSRREIRSIIALVFEYITNRHFLPFYLEEYALIDAERVQAESMLQRLSQSEPIQHILGKAEFYGLSFFVTSNVLVPRPETEELVEQMLLKLGNQQDLSILDIGTGSGAIAITLFTKLKNARVEAWDVSVDALTVAEKNAQINQAKIDFREQDILDEKICNEERLLNSFDAIVSNPPYVLESEKSEMHRNVLDYDPALALFVPDDDPLIFYRTIARCALKWLKPQGLLFFEINRSQGLQMISLLETMGYQNIVLMKDLSQNDRIIIANKP